MPKPKNAMEIFALLDKSNCRECGLKTCMAFAGAVFTGQKNLRDCPRLDAETISRFSEEPSRENGMDDIQADYLEQLKKEIGNCDLAEAAPRTGGQYSDGKLTIPVLGKNFTVDAQGNFFTDIHVNIWVAAPLLHYILYGKGLDISGDWRSFRELKNGREKYPLFQKRGEEAMKQVADIHTGFFDDIVHMFSGKEVEKQFASDISVVLHPLPKVPIMICYWKPEDGLASNLNMFFDKTADENLGADAAFNLGTGLARMFEKLSQRHGFAEGDRMFHS
ncbi:MAG: DUF3786 domain-containing protein [Desulfococcaceae bacterium]